MDGICWNFSQDCPTCDKPVQVTNGIAKSHPDCAPPPSLVIEGCGGTGLLTDRVEQALADGDLLNDMTP